MSWRVSDEEVAPLASGAEMLPLIVGQIASATEEETQPEADVIDAEDVADDEASDTLDIVEAEIEDESTAPIANADAPPADYVTDAETPEERRKDAT